MVDLKHHFQCLIIPPEEQEDSEFNLDLKRKPNLTPSDTPVQTKET